MPYSPSHRYIHICIPKTGSTSVSIAFKQFHAEHGGSQLFLREPVDDAFRDRYGLWEVVDSRRWWANHLSASELRHVLGEEFDRCFKFTFVRNPYARCLSVYRFSHVDQEPSREEKLRLGVRRSFHNLSFEHWLRRKYLRWRCSLWRRRDHSQLCRIVDGDGRLLVDFVGRLETVQPDMDRICDRIGIPRLEVPHRNPTRHGHYTEYYDARLRRIVERMYAKDLETFGYAFGD